MKATISVGDHFHNIKSNDIDLGNGIDLQMISSRPKHYISFHLFGLARPKMRRTEPNESSGNVLY